MTRSLILALAAHSELAALLPADGGDCEAMLAQFARAGVDVDALAARIQAGRTEGGARLHKGGPGEGQ